MILGAAVSEFGYLFKFISGACELVGVEGLAAYTGSD